VSDHLDIGTVKYVSFDSIVELQLTVHRTSIFQKKFAQLAACFSSNTVWSRIMSCDV